MAWWSARLESRQEASGKDDLQSRPTAVPAITLGLLLVRTYPMVPPAAVSAARTYAGSSRPWLRCQHENSRLAHRGRLYHFVLFAIDDPILRYDVAVGRGTMSCVSVLPELLEIRAVTCPWLTQARQLPSGRGGFVALFRHAESYVEACGKTHSFLPASSRLFPRPDRVKMQTALVSI